MAKAMPVLGLDPENTLCANAALIIPLRIAELLAWERFIADPARVTELHEMRIAAKRLRYTLELFAPCYGPDFAGALDRIKGIQEQLGRIHDADVLVPELREQAGRMLQPGRKNLAGVYEGDFDAVAGLLALCRRQRAVREKLYRKFLAQWAHLRAEGYFEALRQMAREAAGREAAAGAESSRPARRAGRNAARKNGAGGDQHGKNGSSRRAVARERGLPGTGGDTGTGDHPGADSGESGLGQYSLFEDRDAG